MEPAVCVPHAVMRLTSPWVGMVCSPSLPAALPEGDMLYPLVCLWLEVVFCAVGHGAPGDACPLSPAPRVGGRGGRMPSGCSRRRSRPGPRELRQPTGSHCVGDSRPPSAVSSGPSRACVGVSRAAFHGASSVGAAGGARGICYRCVGEALGWTRALSLGLSCRRAVRLRPDPLPRFLWPVTGRLGRWKPASRVTEHLTVTCSKAPGTAPESRVTLPHSISAAGRRNPPVLPPPQSR